MSHNEPSPSSRSLKRSSNKTLAGLLALAVLAWVVPSVQAQPACPYADIQLDTEQSVDVEAVCEAAQPWADDGIRPFIFLTDHRPANEDAWFEFLDQVEIKAGIRGQDGFDRNALAFEASTASDLSWAYSITYGELLYDSPLDTDDAAIFRIKNQLRSAIAAGDPTGAFVQALSIAYEINHLPLTVPTQQPPVPTPTVLPSPTEPASPSPWGRIVLIVVIVGALGAGGYALAVYVIRPAVQRARHRAELKRHLETLQTRTANLLNACDQLLQGDTPEETIPYQLFSAYGGEHYDDVRAQVHEWLRRSQGALDDAFDVRKKLLDPALPEKRSLEQTVQDWELLYLTLVGNSDRILALSDEELRTLLDPLLVRERQAPDVQLTQQLDELRQELAGGLPLKVELRMVDPTQGDAEGILGYVDRVKAQVAHLQQARQEAPQRLAKAQAQRQTAEEEVPSPFVMTEKQLFQGIDERLAQASDALEQEVFLRVIELAEQVNHGVETIKILIANVGEHERRQTEIEAITRRGYRPESLPEDVQEIETDLQTISQEIEAGDYVAAASWIEELSTDSQRALANAQAWQLLHEQNTSTLHQLGDELARIKKIQADKAEPAWQTLRDYPEGNWKDVADGLEQARQTLQRLQDDQINQITQLNSLEKQQLTKAEHMLAQASADLTLSERQLEGVINRLAEVQTAEAHIPEALRLTKAEIDKATTLRDKEDLKIGPEVDEQIAQAREQLAQGRRLAESREYIAATNAQTAARDLASAAYAAASEQVQEINALHTELETLADGVCAEADHCQASAQALPAVAQTTETNQLVQQVATRLSQAQQARTAAAGLQDHALAEALRTAVAAYKEVDQLADQAVQRITADRDAYDRLLTETRNAVYAAQSALQRAKWIVNDATVWGAGRRPYERAQKTLSQIGSTDNATREALVRMRQQAQKAESDAKQAERQARQKRDAAQAERRRRRERSSWSSSSWSSSGSSSGRRRSSSSSRRSSSRSSSRRSSSRASSRRSSSRGSSRRR
jgi:hypothetical protein